MKNSATGVDLVSFQTLALDDFVYITGGTARSEILAESSCADSETCKANLRLLAQFFNFGDGGVNDVQVTGAVNLTPDGGTRVLESKEDRMLEESSPDLVQAGFELDVQLSAPVSSATFLETGWARATSLSLAIVASFLTMSMY